MADVRICDPAGIKAVSEALGWIDVRSYGAVGDGVTDDSPAIQAAINAASVGYGIVFLPSFTYSVETPLAITTDGVKIVGAGKSACLKIGGSSAGLFTITDAKNVGLENFSFDLDNFSSAIGIYLLGAWYTHIKNVWSDKSHEDITSYGLYVESGSIGSGHEGSYVNYFKNIVVDKVKIAGDATRNVTTETFINLDCSNVIAAHVIGLTFIQPVIQNNAGIMFDLDYVSGFTAVGGDYEGTNSTIYKFGTSCRGINSIGNQISGAGNTYIDGVPTASSYFADDNTTAVENPLYVGGLQPLEFQNSATTEKSRIGFHYDGGVFQISNNIEATDSDEGNLDDVSKSGSIITLDTSGRVFLGYAQVGANPRVISNAAQFDNGGAIIGVDYVYANNAAALDGGLTEGRLYRTATGELMIVYIP